MHGIDRRVKPDNRANVPNESLSVQDDVYSQRPICKRIQIPSRMKRGRRDG